MNLLKNRKASIEGTPIGVIMTFVVLLLVIAVVISFGAETLNSIQYSQSNDVSTLANNQTLTWGGNNTAISLLANNIVGGTFVLYDNGTKVNQGTNYTLNLADGTVTIINITAPVGGWITETLNASYSYFIGSDERNITGKGITTQVTFAKWLPTIALVLIISVILGILIVYLANRMKRE